MPVEGKRVLVVEDEALVAMMLEDLLTELGCAVAGVAWRLPQAVDLAETVDADAAILDINLAGERVYPVAEVLLRRRIPFIFATGYGRQGLPPEFATHPVLTKPVDRDELVDALTALLGEPD